MAKQENIMKEILDIFAKGAIKDLNYLIEQKIITKPIKVNDGRIKITITSEKEVAAAKSHRSYQERLGKTGGKATIKGNTVTIEIPTSSIAQKFIKSGGNLGDYLENVFNAALVKEILEKFGDLGTSYKSLQTYLDENADIYGRILNAAPQIRQAANDSAKFYVRTYLSNKKECEEYLKVVISAYGDFQLGFGANTAIGDTILDSRTLKMRPRVIELKNYGLPTSKTPNPSIHWMTSSDNVLFGGTGMPLYMRWLYDRRAAYQGENKLSDNEFLKNFSSSLGDYLKIALQKISNSPYQQLRFILNKGKTNPSLKGKKEKEILDLAKKIIISVSPDGSKVMISGPFDEIYKELKALKNQGKLVAESQSGEYVFLDKTSESPLQRLASLGFNDRDIAAARAKALKSIAGNTLPDKVPTTTIQSYIYYALQKMGGGQFL